MKYIKATINSEYHEIFVTFEDQPKETTSLKISNKCEDLDIKIYQTCLSSNEGLILKSNKTIPFAWNYPNKERKIYVDFMKGHSYYYHSFDDIFNFDAINKTTAFAIPGENGKIIQIYTNVVLEETSRILTFYSKDPNSTRQIKKIFFKKLIERVIKEKILLQTHLRIKGIGLSFISTLKGKNDKTHRTEIIYMIIKNIDLIMVQSNLQKNFHLRVKYFNIDSNVSFLTTFPVLMTPTLPKGLRDPDTKKYFLDIVSYGTPLPQEKVSSYKSLKILLDGSTLTIDGHFINALLQIAKNMRNMKRDDTDLDKGLNIEDLIFTNTPNAWVNISLSYYK